jgi:phage terminase large subunit-like protein
MLNKGHYLYYITTDAATSDSKTADFSVIQVWAVDDKKKLYLADWWFGKTILSEFLNELFAMTKKWKKNLMGVGIEVSGQQGGTISTINDKMRAEDNYFFLISSGNGDNAGMRPPTGMRKYERFQSIQPWFATGRIHFPENMENDPFMIELKNELRFVSKTNTGSKIGKSRFDDLIDTIAMLGVIDIVAASDELKMPEPEVVKHKIDPFWGDMRPVGPKDDSGNMYGSYV